MKKWAEKEAAIRALERGGKVDPNDLIAAARSPDHPCHDDFTWDVEQAAAERWRDQARALIRAVHFEVTVDEATERIVQYVPVEGEARVFESLPKIRSKGKASAVLLAEVSMLHGLASRVYGVALAKENLVGADVVLRLGVIRDQLAELKSEIG